MTFHLTIKDTLDAAYIVVYTLGNVDVWFFRRGANQPPNIGRD